MNYIKRNYISIEELDFYNEIRENCTIKNVQRIIYQLRRYKKIRYKDSIKRFDIEIPSIQTPILKISR